MAIFVPLRATNKFFLGAFGMFFNRLSLKSIFLILLVKCAVFLILKNFLSNSTVKNTVIIKKWIEKTRNEMK